MSEEAEQSITLGSDSSTQKPPVTVLPTDGYSAMRDTAASSDTTLSKAVPVSGGQNTAVVPPSSFSLGRASTSLQQRRKKGVPMMLYVRSSGGNTSGDPKNEEKDESTPTNSLVPVESTQDDAESTVLHEALEMFFKVAQAVKGALPAVMRTAKNRGLFTPLLVFIFFLVVLIFTLHVTQEHLEWMSRVAEHENGQGILFVSSLTEQLIAKANEADEIMLPFKRSPPVVVEKMEKSVRELAALREANIRQLHSRLGYPGPVEDIQFLVEEHVAYRVNLARLAKEELEWIRGKKHGRADAQEASSTRTTGPNERPTDKKRDDEEEEEEEQRQQQQQPIHTVVLQPGGETSESPGRVFDTLQLLTSWLNKRVLAVPLILLLTVIYVRLN